MADRGMGRGLAAILAVTPHEQLEELRELPVDLVAPNPNQPRRAFDEEGLLALAESIRSRGVLQPVLVRPLAGRYELIAGERRWRAARLAERETIPAVVRHRGDAGSLELALIENMAREDLNPVDQARGCAALVEELGLTREEVGLRVGRSRVTVANLIRLLDLPDEALELIERGELTEGHGRALLLAGSTRNAGAWLARRPPIGGRYVSSSAARARPRNRKSGSGACGQSCTQIKRRLWSGSRRPSRPLFGREVEVMAPRVAAIAYNSSSNRSTMLSSCAAPPGRHRP